MSWISLALISIISVSIATLLERVLMKDNKSDPVGYAIVFQFTLGLFSFIAALMFGKFILPPLGVSLFRFLISACLWAGATVFSFLAIKRLSAGEVTILTTSSSVISIALSVLFLQETFQSNILIGALLIFVSIWLVNIGNLSFTSRKGVVFALLSATCAGIAVVNDAFILRTYEAFSYTTIMSFLPGIVLMLFFPKKIVTAKTLCNVKAIGLMSIFCFFYAIQAITYYLAFQRGAPVAQLSPLTKSSIILTVILGAVFLNERKDLLRKVVASVVVTIGAVLLK